MSNNFRAIKVVLEGNFASLCALGFPLTKHPAPAALSEVPASEAYWTSRSTDTSFSVSFFWPAREKENMDIKKRKRRKRGKARPQVVRATTPNSPKQCAPYRGIVTSASNKLSPDLQSSHTSVSKKLSPDPPSDSSKATFK